MIIINKESDNTVILELLFNASLTAPYYFFQFRKKDTDFVKEFVGSDISINNCRYQKFKISENSSEDLLNSIVSLPIGEYDYTIWEIYNKSLTDTKLNQLGEGIVQVIGESSSIYD